MKIFKSLLFGFALLVLTKFQVSAVTYYVNNSIGSDTYNGRSSARGTGVVGPWRTIGRVNEGNYLPGDVIYFRGGQTFDGTLFFHAGNAHGTATQPVKVTSNGTGTATIASGDTNGIVGDNVAGITITKLNVTGTSRIHAPSDSNLYYTDGIYFQCNLPGDVKLDTIKLDTVNVSGYGGSGIVFWGLQGNCGFKNVILTNVISHDNACDGIVFTSVAPLDSYSFENVNISYCVCYNLSGVPIWTLFEGMSADGILLVGVDGGRIDHNTIYNNGTTLAMTWGGPYCIEAVSNRRLIIDYNEVYNQRYGTGACWDSGGINANGIGHRIQYNYTHGSDGPGIMVDGGYDHTVRYNICENDGRKHNQAAIYVIHDTAIDLFGGEEGILDDIRIYNNTVCMGGTSTEVGPCFCVRTWGSPPPSAPGVIIVMNNIFMTKDGKIQLEITNPELAENLILVANVYWNQGGGFKVKWGSQIYTNIDTWMNVTGQVWAGFNLDPGLRNSFAGRTIRTVSNPRANFTALRAYAALLSTSLCIDGAWDMFGFAMIDPGTHDLFDKPIGISLNGSVAFAPDTGASEYQFGDLP